MWRYVQMNATEYAVVVLATMGALFLLISALGVLRLKGVHQRMQALSIGTSAGISLLLLSAGIHYWYSAEMGRMILLIIFFLGTAPIASTAMSRAGYRLQKYHSRRHLVYDDMESPEYLADYKSRDPGLRPESTGDGQKTVEQGTLE